MRVFILTNYSDSRNPTIYSWMVPYPNLQPPYPLKMRRLSVATQWASPCWFYWRRQGKGEFHLSVEIQCGNPGEIGYSQIGLSVNSTSSTAQGGGGSFKNRKPIGEIGCCESPMAEQKH